MLSYLEINPDALYHNLKELKNLVRPQTQIAAVVKANAYGHDQNLVAQVLEDQVDYFQVDDLDELRKLRRVLSKPTLMLGYVPIGQLEELVGLDGVLGLYDLERARQLNKIGEEQDKQIPVHIKIDAFLGRQGILPQNVDDFLIKLKVFTYISVEGVYAHFANIEDTSDFVHAQKQIDTFKQAVGKFHRHGYNNFVTHMSATSGVMVYDSKHHDFDLVRIGIGLYGLWPSADIQKRFDNRITLKPVLRWVTHVAQVKTLPAEFPVGYGLTYITPQPTQVAVIPQGYSDGYDRGLSNTGEVLIHGMRCRVLGRVAMNMFVVDVSHLDDVQVEDEVILLGQQGDERITAEEIANKLGTINYEVVARISPLLPRVKV